MNKRIEKFARECGAWNQVYGNRNFMIDEHFDIEKFARLVVKECCDVVDYNNAQAIVNHLGVEE
jgi:alkyl hydroperoxide reductase subunit AhpF